jgi:hypothetical protein
MAQLTHASSTGFLIVLAAPHVSAVQEATWYALYAVLLGAGALAIRSALPAAPRSVPARSTS